MVTLVDPDPMDTTVFHTGDTFNIAGLTDLHLMLETLGPDSEVVAESTSDIDSTQQIFFQIPETGDYELVVDQVGQRREAAISNMAWHGGPRRCPSRAANCCCYWVLYLWELRGGAAGARTEPAAA